jgi:hypothetical protein
MQKANRLVKYRQILIQRSKKRGEKLTMPKISCNFVSTNSNYKNEINAKDDVDARYRVVHHGFV